MRRRGTIRDVQWERVGPAVWAVVLGLLLLGPALVPGYVLTYDMVWVPDLRLGRDALGLGSALPRAVPSDAVVAVLDEVLGGMLLQKLVLLVAVAFGGLGILRLLADAPPTAAWVAVSFYGWSPYLVERLHLGAWPMLLAYAMLPWVLHGAAAWRSTGRPPRWLGLVLVVGSLSANAGIATAIALWAGGARRDRGHLALLAAVSAACNAPWIVAGLLTAGSGTSDRAGVAAFALSSEGSMPAPLAAITLGGVWNDLVVPDSRTGLLGLTALLLTVTLVAFGLRAFRDVDRRLGAALLVCWAVGMVAALATWAVPDAIEAVVSAVPGGGLLRDGGRWLLLCAPAVAIGCGLGAARVVDLVSESVPRLLLAGALTVAPVLLLPDALWGIGGDVAAVDYPDDYEAVVDTIGEDPVGTAVLLPFESYRAPAFNEGRSVLDPLGRFLPVDTVTNDELIVGGDRIGGEDPVAADVRAGLAAPTAADRARRLRELGVGYVVIDLEAYERLEQAPLSVDGEVTRVGSLALVILDDHAATTVRTGSAVAMGAAWLLFMSVAPAVLTGGRSHRVFTES